MSPGAMTITGAKELERKLLGLERKVARKVVSQSLRKGAKIVLAAARQEAPQRTGKLRKSLKVRRAKRNRRGSYAITVSTSKFETMYAGETFYGAFVHWGHFVGKRTGGGTSRGGARGRRKVEANPFIRRAYERTKNRARDVVLRDMAAGIERVGQERA